MNTPLQNIHPKVANSTAHTKRSTVQVSNPRANAIANVGKSVKQRISTDSIVRKNDRMKSFGGKGWGGP